MFFFYFFCFFTFIPIHLSSLSLSSLLLSLLSLFSLSLGGDTKWPTRADVSLNLKTGILMLVNSSPITRTEIHLPQCRPRTDAASNQGLHPNLQQQEQLLHFWFIRKSWCVSHSTFGQVWPNATECTPFLGVGKHFSTRTYHQRIGKSLFAWKSKLTNQRSEMVIQAVSDWIFKTDTQ